MNTSDYTAIGKAMKRLHPGEFDDLEDDAAIGLIAVKKGFWPPKLPDVDHKPHFFLGTRGQHIGKQIEFVDLHRTKETTLLARELRHAVELTELPRRVIEESESRDRQVEMQRLTDQVAQETAKLSALVTTLASQQGVDVATYNQVRLLEETARIEMEKIRATAQIEIAKAQGLAEIELLKYEREKQIDVSILKLAAEVKRLIDGQSSGKTDTGTEFPGNSQDSEGE